MSERVREEEKTARKFERGNKCQKDETRIYCPHYKKNGGKMATDETVFAILCVLGCIHLFPPQSVVALETSPTIVTLSRSTGSLQCFAFTIIVYIRLFPFFILLLRGETLWTRLFALRARNPRFHCSRAAICVKPFERYRRDDATPDLLRLPARAATNIQLRPGFD